MLIRVASAALAALDPPPLPFPGRLGLRGSAVLPSEAMLSAVRGLHDRHRGLTEYDVAELDPPGEQRHQLQADQTALEPQEGRGAELGVFSNLEIAELDGRQREHADREPAELDRASQGLRRRRCHIGLDPRGVYQERNRDRRSGHQQEHDRAGGQSPLHPSPHEAAVAPWVTRSGSPSAARGACRRTG